jgi:hypothetical protein
MRGSSEALPIMNERGLADKMVWKTKKGERPFRKMSNIEQLAGDRRDTLPSL